MTWQPELSFGAPEAPSGVQLRDRGTDTALNRAGDEWRDDCIAIILREWGGRHAIAEDWRQSCEAKGFFAHHPNAWGALTLYMKRQGWLHETGEWRSPADSRSHARPTRVYRVAEYSL